MILVEMTPLEYYVLELKVSTTAANDTNSGAATPVPGQKKLMDKALDKK